MRMMWGEPVSGNLCVNGVAVGVFFSVMMVKIKFFVELGGVSGAGWGDGVNWRF